MIKDYLLGDEDTDMGGDDDMATDAAETTEEAPAVGMDDEDDTDMGGDDSEE